MAIEQDEKKQLIQNKLAFAFDLTFVPTSLKFILIILILMMKRADN